MKRYVKLRSSLSGLGNSYQTWEEWHIHQVPINSAPMGALNQD